MVEQSTFNHPIMMPPTMTRDITPHYFDSNNSGMSPASMKTHSCTVQSRTLLDDNTHENGEFNVNNTKAMNDKQEDDDDEYQDIDDDDDVNDKAQELKDLDWDDLPNFIRHLDYNQLKADDCHKANSENRTILSIRRK
ncbi:unnamed protein product, partial [Rotaria magnacalcarata]